ncbi:LOW QUALITY PROTEIN: hypothetical protein Bca101_043000 [Brassica carinata]
MASGQKKFSESEKGKSIRIEPDPPSLGPKLMSSAIRSASVGLAGLSSDRARVAGGTIEKEGNGRFGSNDREDGAAERTPAVEVDWEKGNVPCEETRGKRLPLPLMGIVPKAYPSYRDILDTQLGGESFNSEEKEKNDTDAPVEKADARADGAVTGGSVDQEGTDPHPEKKKKRKRKKKPSMKAQVRSDEREGSGTEGDEQLADQMETGERRFKRSRSKGLQQTRSRKGRWRPRGQRGSSEGELTSVVGKRQKVPDGRSIVSAGNDEQMVSLPVNRRLPWGGSDPPIARFSAAESERIEFLYDGEVPFVNNSAACGDLTRRIRGGTKTMPEVSELAFSDMYADSARADAMAIARKNILIMEYEVALRKTVSELRAAEATMKAREEEFEKAKREVLKKAKELVAERDRHCRERRQAIQAAGDLEEELETARTKIAAMKQEKIDEAERTRKEMDRLRQSRLYEVMCERNRVTAGANRRFEKFRRYMIDRDKQEEKLFLHSQASGTLDSIGMLEDRGLQVPKVLKDLLVNNEAKYKKELAEVVVEEITERDLVLSPSRSVILRNFDQFGSNLEVVDPASAAALRSPVLGDDAPIDASGPTDAGLAEVAAPGGREGQGIAPAGLEMSRAEGNEAVAPSASVEEQ